MTWVAGVLISPSIHALPGDEARVSGCVFSSASLAHDPQAILIQQYFRITQGWSIMRP
jgi:hypothetical protein